MTVDEKHGHNDRNRCWCISQNRGKLAPPASSITVSRQTDFLWTGFLVSGLTGTINVDYFPLLPVLKLAPSRGGANTHATRGFFSPPSLETAPSIRRTHVVWARNDFRSAPGLDTGWTQGWAPKKGLSQNNSGREPESQGVSPVEGRTPLLLSGPLPSRETPAWQYLSSRIDHFYQTWKRPLFVLLIFVLFY